jgi:hypothetical protein
MDIATITTIGNVASAVVKYGAPAVRKIVDELQDKGDPTLEEIEALAEMLKEPEEYFKDKD